MRTFLNNTFTPFKEVSIAPLVVFRIIFGTLLLFSSARYIAKGWVNDLYIEPELFFGFLGFEWVKPLPGNWMYIPFVLMILSAIGIILGAFYRWSSLLYFLSFTYVELLDKSNYLNHYYFVSLMCFLLILVPANRAFSLDVRRNPSIRQDSIFTWHTGVLKFQLAVVYIFAGIAKINTDWLLEAQPLKIWLQAHHNLPIVGELMREDWLAYAFSWFGCIYDLFIVFFLLLPTTRKFAYFFVIVFHVVTWSLFPIGVFPWVMICSTTIFFSVEFHEKILNFLKSVFKSKRETLASSKLTKTSKSIQYFLVLYIAFQLLIPFRYALYPGNLYWNEEGFRFSWRVMLMHKEGNAVFYIRDLRTSQEIEIDNSTYLTQTQEDQMATQPDMILQYAEFLQNEYQDKTLTFGKQDFTMDSIGVFAKIHVSLNGRPSKIFVDKNIDLSLQPYNLKHRNWLKPFEE